MMLLLRSVVEAAGTEDDPKSGLATPNHAVSSIFFLELHLQTRFPSPHRFSCFPLLDLVFSFRSCEVDHLSFRTRGGCCSGWGGCLQHVLHDIVKNNLWCWTLNAACTRNHNDKANMDANVGATRCTGHTSNHMCISVVLLHVALAELESAARKENTSCKFQYVSCVCKLYDG